MRHIEILTLILRTATNPSFFADVSVTSIVCKIGVNLYRIRILVALHITDMSRRIHIPALAPKRDPPPQES